MALRCLLLFFLFAMTSCQYNAEEKAEKAEKTQKRGDAVSYNIQLGMGYLRQGDAPRAKRKFLNAIELGPNSSDANGAMAYFLEKTGDIKEATAYYRKALALAPNSGAQLNNYGTFLCRAGKYKEAEAYFLKSVQDSSYVNSAGAWENAGLCATGIPDYVKAETYFLRALGQDSHRRQSLAELVSIELKKDNSEKALAYLNKYQEIVLNDPNLLAMAITAANKAGKSETEADYKERLDRLNNTTDSGVKNEYDDNNR